MKKFKEKEEEMIVAVIVMMDHQIGEVEEVDQMALHLHHGVQKQKKEVVGENVKKQGRKAGVQGTVMKIEMDQLIDKKIEVDGVIEKEVIETVIVMSGHHSEEN